MPANDRNFVSEMETAMNDGTGNVTTEALTLFAKDGYPLGATRYLARSELKGHLIMAGATGVNQRFYRRFAHYASARGYTTLTFDYRGVGRSRPVSLKDFEASFLTWGRLDLAAAVEAMASDIVPLFMAGHSFGGHALGMLPNHERIAGCYCFGSGAGWAGWMPWREALKVRILWNVILPPLVAWKGYMPWSLLRMGDDLPLGVYRQWRQWCVFPAYFFDDPRMAHLTKSFAQVRTPIVAATALDDRWAPPRSLDAFMAGYKNAPVKRIDLDPRRGGGHIGHMGYFREQAQALWDDMLGWFEQQRLQAHVMAAQVESGGRRSARPQISSSRGDGYG